ncbi:hypothetical protein C8J55DRAFT_503107 [Lentinula edodes]|uniref:Uncharacterized protein n=1 Tax=Lentinula lateritia TaxID=40482 RepID=A0A9W9AYN9_9AGAR|nr:hypothetical protein C8J55DRAFT_503107 [Lentinula edodes]
MLFGVYPPFVCLHSLTRFRSPTPTPVVCTSYTPMSTPLPPNPNSKLKISQSRPPPTPYVIPSTPIQRHLSSFFPPRHTTAEADAIPRLRLIPPPSFSLSPPFVSYSSQRCCLHLPLSALGTSTLNAPPHSRTTAPFHKHRRYPLTLQAHLPPLLFHWHGGVLAQCCSPLSLHLYNPTISIHPTVVLNCCTLVTKLKVGRWKWENYQWEVGRWKVEVEVRELSIGKTKLRIKFEA